jgi:hypothetical protein
MHALPAVPPSPPVRWVRPLGRVEFTRLFGASVELVLVRDGGLSRLEARRLARRALRSAALRLGAETRRVRAWTRSECRAELERERAAAVLAAPAADDGLSALAEDLRAARVAEEAVAGVLARERVRRSAAWEARARAAAERIDRLERRLAKLRAAQAETERHLAELARRAARDAGLPSTYRTVQGLAADEEGREAKLAMLARVFEENVAFQRRCA